MLPLPAVGALLPLVLLVPRLLEPDHLPLLPLLLRPSRPPQLPRVSLRRPLLLLPLRRRRRLEREGQEGEART